MYIGAAALGTTALLYALDVIHVHSVSRVIGTHRQRTVLGLTLMACQAFCYNALGFTYSLVLTKFYGIPAASVGWARTRSAPRPSRLARITAWRGMVGSRRSMAARTSAR